MAKTKVSEWSSTAASNTDIDSINIAEGCAPSGINDAIRELMSQLKDFQAGTAGDSFNGPVGTTTAAAGAFTTLSASGAVTLSGGTANGVPYLNGSKVLTTGSALVFDGSNLGLGVTPSAWAGDKALQVAWGSISSGYEYSVNVSSVAYRDNASWKYLASSQAPARYEQISGGHKWYTAPSGTAGNAITFTQAMTLTNGGIWKLGTTGNGPYSSIGVMSYDGSTNWSVGPYSGNPGGFLITANASYGVYLATTTSTSWATASDERVKTDLEPITDAAAKVATLRAVTGRYLADPTGPRKPFLIAQDVLAVLPEAVDTSNPEKYGLAYTEVIPLLVAAIKEQQALIEQLKADVAVLKSK